MKRILHSILRHYHERAHHINFGVIGLISVTLSQEHAGLADYLFVVLSILTELSTIDYN